MAHKILPEQTRNRRQRLSTLYLCCMLACGNLYLSAQAPHFSLEYGTVTPHELVMKEYTPDKDAEAVVLYEKGRYYFSGDYTKGRFELNMEIVTKVKILRQAGIKYAEFEIPYYVSSETESIRDLEGTTYNLENGRIEKSVLDRKNVFEEKPVQNWRVKKFAMPNVREGSVVEVKYVITTPYYFNMREWDFQKKIPVVYSVLEYRAIPYYEYVYILKGANKFDEFEQEVINSDIQFGRLKYREVAFIMGMKDLPAFKDEEFIASEKDYMISLNFQIARYNYPGGGRKDVMSTWPLICDELLKHDNFGKYMKASEKSAQKILPFLDMQTRTEEERIKAITGYVKMNYNWNRRTTNYASLKPADLLKQKTGNSADINLFLAGMLQAAGFDAKPVVLSTRQHGMVSVDHPFVQFLNYVIVQVAANDTTYLLDATEPMLRFDELPERCINVNGLVVKPKSEEWIGIVQNAPALTEKNFEIRLDGDLAKLQVKTDVIAHANDAYNYRAIYRNDVSNLTNRLRAQDIEPLGEIIVENYSEIDQPFTFSFRYETTIEQIDNKLFIPPFLNQSVTENIFKQSQRTLPVDLVLFRSAKYKSTIQIPEGYKIEYIPESKDYNNKTMTINYKAEQVGDNIEITAGYTFKQNMYAARDYPVLKISFDGIINTFNEMIVLVKK